MCVCVHVHACLVVRTAAGLPVLSAATLALVGQAHCGTPAHYAPSSPRVLASPTPSGVALDHPFSNPALCCP